MLRINILLFFLISIQSLIGQRYHQNELISSDNSVLSYFKKDNSLVSGFVYCDYGDIGNFINGKREGIHKEWYLTGELRAEWNFKNGLPEGEVIRRFKNWQIQSKLNYQNGLLEGLSKSWHETGEINAEMNFKNGMLHGSLKIWDLSGTIIKEGNYMEGVAIFEKCWDLNGNKIVCD